MPAHFIENLRETLRQFKEERGTIAKAVRDMEALLAALSDSEPQKRRGRPPGSKNAAAPKRRGRPPSTAKAQGTGKRRGRPPGSKNAVATAPTGRKQGQRTWTPEQRKAAGRRLAKARAAKAKAADAREAAEPGEAG